MRWSSDTCRQFVILSATRLGQDRRACPELAEGPCFSVEAPSFSPVHPNSVEKRQTACAAQPALTQDTQLQAQQTSAGRARPGGPTYQSPALQRWVGWRDTPSPGAHVSQRRRTQALALATWRSPLPSATITLRHTHPKCHPLSLISSPTGKPINSPNALVRKATSMESAIWSAMGIQPTLT